MLKKNNFFKYCLNNFSNYKINIKKVKKVYSSFLLDFENNKIPLLDTYEKNYEFDFSAATIKKYSKYKNIVIIGMGGSILGAKSIYSFFKKKIKKNVFFLDNLDLNLEYNKIKNLKNCCFIVISKSGNTLETIVNLSTIFSKSLLKNKLIIITEFSDNALMSIAKKYQADVIEHKDFISGRYSVLSETGIFPAALMGVNFIKLKNLKKLLKRKEFTSALIQNVAAIYTLSKKRINNSIILSYDSSLNDLGYWYQQLVAESLGKKGKGITPTLSFGPKDHHSLFQLYLDGPKDKFFTFFHSSNKESLFKIKHDVISTETRFIKNKSLNSIINAQINAAKNIFKLKKIPFREINFQKKNEEELGETFIFFVLETILLSRLMNINPFNQPAVEQIKVETRNILN
jgi:glucose-6-phosphate isomerase